MQSTPPDNELHVAGPAPHGTQGRVAGWRIASLQVKLQTLSLKLCALVMLVQEIWGRFRKLGILFGDLHTKDYNILRSILGSPYCGKLPYRIPGSGCRPLVFSLAREGDWNSKLRT